MKLNGKPTESAPLGALVDIAGGGTPSMTRPDFYTDAIPWVTPKDMKSWYIDDSQDHITQAAIESSSTKLIDAGAMLLPGAAIGS